MPRSKQQNEQMRAATRAAIVDGAMSLFAQKGYGATTTREIARQAGISTGLMYHYFAGKERLLHAVFANCMDILSEAFADVYRQAAPGERLAPLLQTIFQMLSQDEAFWTLFYALRSQPAVMEVLGDDFRAWTRRLRDLFTAELQEAGRANPELDAYILYSLVEGTIQQYLLEPDSYPLQQVVAQIVTRFSRPDPD